MNWLIKQAFHLRFGLVSIAQYSFPMPSSFFRNRLETQVVWVIVALRWDLRKPRLASHVLVVVVNGLKFVNPRLPPPRRWDYRCAPPRQAYTLFLDRTQCVSPTSFFLTHRPSFRANYECLFPFTPSLLPFSPHLSPTSLLSSFQTVGTFLVLLCFLHEGELHSLFLLFD